MGDRNQLLAVSVIVVAGLVAGPAATVPVLSVLIGGAAAVILIARAPRLALYMLIPVVMWPQEWAVAGIPVQQSLLALFLVGASLGSIAQIRGAVQPLLLTLGLCAVIGVSYLKYGDPVVLEPGEASNHMLALFAAFALVPVVAMVKPDPVTTMKVLGVSSVVASLGVLTTAETVGGRATLETYNSDGIGQAAAIGMLLLAGMFILTRQPWWLLLALVPTVSFMSAQTRSALVILAAGLALLGVLRLTGRARVAATLLAAAAIPLLVGPALTLQRALFSARDERHLEVDGRFDALDLALRTMVEHPLLGVGYRHFLDESSRHLGMVIDPHNDIARIGAEAGVFALALFLFLLARSVTFLMDGKTGIVLRAVALASIGTLVFGNTATDPRVAMPMWVLLGVAWSLPARSGGAPSSFGRRHSVSRAKA